MKSGEVSRNYLGCDKIDLAVTMITEHSGIVSLFMCSAGVHYLPDLHYHHHHSRILKMVLVDLAARVALKLAAFFNGLNGAR